MSTSDKITELGEALSALTRRIRLAAESIRDSAFRAGSTKRLQGLTLQEIKQDIRSGLPVHLSQTNPHNDTAANIGLPTKETVDNELAKLIPSGILPISSYGSNDYLPVSALGSFEGGSTQQSPRASISLLEADGTLVYLRNGTNGSRNGVYYAYLKNAEMGTSIEDPVKTNRKYRPSFIPEDREVLHITSGSDTVIYGRLQDTFGAAKEFFIALTNGTMDDTKHTGSVIYESTINPGWNANIFLHEDTVYAMWNMYTSWNQPFGIAVYKASRSAVESGAPNLFTKVTGITTHGFNGMTNSDRDYIHLADVLVSSNEADNCLIRASGTLSSRNVFHTNVPALTTHANKDGVFRVRLVSGSYFSAPGLSMRRDVSLSFLFDPVTKVATVDPEYLEPNLLVNNGSSITIRGGVYNHGNPLSNGVNSQSNILTTANGYNFNIRHDQGYDSIVLIRTRITNFVDRFTSMNVANMRQENSTSVSVGHLFGSAIGGVISGTYFMTPDTVVTSAGGTAANGRYRVGMAYSRLNGTSEDFVYRSVMAGTYKGYRPHAERAFISDIGANEIHFTQPLIEADSSSMHASSCVFIDQSVYSTTRPTQLNRDFTVSSSTITVTNATLDAIALKVTDLVEDTIGVTRSRFGILILPQKFDIPPLMVVRYLNVSGHSGIIVAALSNVVMDGSTLVNVDVAYVSNPVVISTAALKIGRSHSSRYRLASGATAMYDTGTAILVGIPVVSMMEVVGNTTVSFIHFKYSKSQGRYVFPNNLNHSHGNPGHTRTAGYFAHPDMGFGQMVGDGSSVNDYHTKAVVVTMAKTEAEFDAGSMPVSNYRVLVSQDVADGYTVYFTDSQQLFMNGREYTLEPVSFDLIDITADPSNKTFYVYIQIEDDQPRYVISLTEMAETHLVMYIGKILTDLTQISEMQIDKVTRIDTYRISSFPVGSAIPVSGGHPSEANVLSWY